MWRHVTPAPDTSPVPHPQDAPSFRQCGCQYGACKSIYSAKLAGVVAELQARVLQITWDNSGPGSEFGPRGV